jgi:protein phosphatase
MGNQKPDPTDLEATLPAGRIAPYRSSETTLPVRQSQFRIVSVGRTDMGLRRKNNEDAFHVDGDAGICILADGMGGAAAGELASQMFAETAIEAFTHCTATSEDENLNLLDRAYQMANKRILSHVKDYPGHAGMGCTAEILRFYNNRYAIGHVGDSRTYLFRETELTQLTRDHSLVQDQVDQGLITPEEARKHRLRNVILRAVGTREDLMVDLLPGRVLPGDLFLLCSDGLTDMVEDALISRVLSHGSPLREKVDQLIELANRAGGNDNVTVILSRVMESS